MEIPNSGRDFKVAMKGNIREVCRTIQGIFTFREMKVSEESIGGSKGFKTPHEAFYINL